MWRVEYQSLTEIAQAFGITIQAVSAVLCKAGYHVGYLPRTGSKDPRCRERFMLMALLQKHWTMKNAAIELGIPTAVLRKWMRYHGISKGELLPYVGPRNHSWQGGRCVSKQGNKKQTYVFLNSRENGYLKFNPKWRNQWVTEHKLILENHVGRRLPRGFLAHHIDANSLNNDIGNLACLTTGEHSRIHALIQSVGVSDGTTALAKQWSAANIGYIRLSA
jgi:hypothetical protein